MKKEIIATVLTAIGSGILIAGFIVPPTGEIHHSVLIAFGEILTFSATLFGIKHQSGIK